MEWYHILKGIWHSNKLEFLFWCLIICIGIPFYITPNIHYFIKSATEQLSYTLSIPLFSIAGIVIFSDHIVVFFIFESLFLMVLSRFHRLDDLIRCRTKGKSEIRDSIKNITHHLLHKSSANNLYGNILVSKLEGSHKPRGQNERGESFWFIRRDLDFETINTGSSPTVIILQETSSSGSFQTQIYNDIGSLRNLLQANKINDFYTIQQCINKTWNTVAYADISSLLDAPKYFAKNIHLAYRLFFPKLFKLKDIKINRFIKSLIKKHLKLLSRKKQVRRLFVYPNKNITANCANCVNIKSTDITEIMKLDIYDKAKLEQTLLSKFSEPNRAHFVMDTIYLICLVKLHEYYGIEYRVVDSANTNDGDEKDIVGDLLNGWKDEGSALIDNRTIVRFDDNISEKGVIYYEFIRSPQTKLDAYKNNFNTIWSPAAPMSYSLMGSKHRGVNPLGELLKKYFSSETSAILLEMNVTNFIDKINREL